MTENQFKHGKKLVDIEYNYKKIENDINETCLKANKERKDVIFLAATKTVDVKYINFAISLGLKYIGENKVQEFLSKYEDYDLENANAHFIGHLQSNKVKQIVGKVDLIQSCDSLKLATEISNQSKKLGIISDVLVEVNIGNENNKSGILPEQLEELLCQTANLENIKVKGLMAIPPFTDNITQTCKFFSKMNNLFIDIKAKNIDNIYMDYLSMGMSADYKEAIQTGANIVRVGSLLFGDRIYN